MNKDLKIVKKKFGEKMMHFCRDAFPSLLDKEGLLSNLLLSHFEPNHELYNDIKMCNLQENFKNYICSLLEVKENELETTKTPEELLNEAGYILYECKTEENIQRFKKYYAKGEALCTFNGGRLNSCRVFFAVKKNVDEIKRKDFKNPERQDEYGTSVISIQFTKDGTNTLSIKNRYNHTVSNPDATFSNNLDNIIPGLTDSFEKYYDIKQIYKGDDLEIPNYVLANDGKFYKYNIERNNIYYCPNNIVIKDFKVHRYPKERYIVFDYYFLNLQNNVFDCENKNDSFLSDLKDIKNINIFKTKNGKKIYVIPNIGEKIEIEIDKENNIISYKNNNLTSLGFEFLRENIKLSSIECPHIELIENRVLEFNEELTKINFPKLKNIGSKFLQYNKKTNEVELPSVEIIGDNFLRRNEKLTKISLPRVECIGDNFLSSNEILDVVDCPNLVEIGEFCLTDNLSLQRLSLPKTNYIGRYFLYQNERLKELNLPNVTYIAAESFYCNNDLLSLKLPKIEIIGDDVLGLNTTIKEFYVPNVTNVGRDFLYNNQLYQSLDFESFKNYNGKSLKRD